MTEDGNTGDENSDPGGSDPPTVPGIPSGEDLTDEGSMATDGSQLEALGEQEGWQVEESAARVHYSGATDRYSIEFYAPSTCTIYWKVPPEGSEKDTAVPVGRDTVPTPLRERIRADLAAAGIDPEIERRTI